MEIRRKGEKKKRKEKGNETLLANIGTQRAVRLRERSSRMY
jgi:hypothetical protein